MFTWRWSQASQEQQERACSDLQAPFKFLILSHLLLSQWLMQVTWLNSKSVWKGTTRSMDIGGNYDHFANNPLQNLRKRLQVTEIWLFSVIKGTAWHMKLKTPHMAGFRSLNFSPRIYLSPSLNCLHLKMTSFSGSFITGTKSLTPPAFIPLLSSLQRSVLNVRTKIYLWSTAGL